METGLPGKNETAPSGATILVADDSDAIRTRLISLIQHVPGVSAILSASNAREVLDQLEKARPGLALVDVHLGDGGGGLFRRIKQEHPGVTLVALMRYPVPQVATIYRIYGADHCFDKTTEVDAILETVTQSVLKKEPEGDRP
ncbi:MAG: response regulator transcription factor [Lentisphaerae bacterium]|nr:response regulator transcription factor [Lentisphaerota bacterium]